MDSPPKKKHHKHHHTKDSGPDENDEDQQNKAKHHHQHARQRRKDTFIQELKEIENTDSNNLLPEITAKKRGAAVVEAKFSSSGSSQSKKEEEKAKELKALVEKKGSTSKITKKKKKSSFGIESIIKRIDLKKPKTASSIGSGASFDSLRSPPGSIEVSLTKPKKMKTSLSYGSEGSRGGRDTPEDDYYDTEELRVLNHEKMVYLINKKTNPVVKKWKAWIAKLDSFAAKHPTVFHNLCIKISITMVPVLLLSLVWDSVAGFLLEIPHYSMINHPGFMLVFHFLSLPTAMYGYMMRSLMGKSNTGLSRWGVVAMLIHPLLLAYRCFMEWHFNGYRNQEKLYYEWFPHHHNHNEEPHSHFIFHIED